MSDQNSSMTDYDDVDDVIALAERLRSEDESRLSAEEMAEIGGELDIPAKYIEQARAQLAEQREQQDKQKRIEQRQSRARRKVVLAAAAAVVVLVALVGLWSRGEASDLGELHAAIEAQQAQVDNVRARKKAVEKHYAGRPDSVDKDAEIVGAENRIRVETKRLDALVSRYNQRAASFPVSLWTGSQELPAHIPMPKQ